jgi:hypothetical protein
MKFADKLYVAILSIWQNTYKLWIDPTPQDVTLEGVKVDANGNVSNVTIPNLAKSVEKMERWKTDYKKYLPLAMPLNYNAFLHDLGNGHLDGWGQRGDVTIQAVSPLTRGFEGKYIPTRENGMVDRDELATESTPRWFGVYNKGPRVRRGGLYDGWGGQSGGKILKIHKPAGELHAYLNSCMFQLIETFKRRKFRFRGYVWIEAGALSFDIGNTSDGGQINIPSAKQWHFIDIIVNQSEVCSTYMNINIDHSEECELYIAMLNISAIEDEGNHSTVINRRKK